MTTNNEAFEVWFESRFGKEGLKTALNHPYLLDGDYVYESTKDKLLIWQAATTEANKRIAELESEVAELKDAKQDLENEVIHLQEMIEPLQASNHALLEALEENHYSNSSDKAINLYNKAIFSTPAESLALHDNELISKCAYICDSWKREEVMNECCDTAQNEALLDVANNIRALKTEVTK